MKNLVKSGRYPRDDLVGKIFGRLTVISWEGRKVTSNYWLCECSCGNTLCVRAGNLKSGNTKSCGCLQKERTSKVNIKHGMAKTPEYKVWDNMKSRCYDENNKGYKDYGDRGITVCNRWLDKENGLINFYNDMSKRPSKNHSIDRINNNGNYEPSNCRWATQKEQNRNRRDTILISYKGKTKCLAEWAEIIGINRYVLYGRVIKRGWCIEKAFKTPIKTKNTC